MMNQQISKQKKQRIHKLTVKKSKQKQREDL